MGWGGGGGFRCITEFSLAEAEAVTKSIRSTFLTVLGYVKLHYPTRQDELLLCHSLESEAVTTFLKKRDIEERQTDRHSK